MSKDTFDAVLASTPQGAIAGRVTSKGVHYEPDVDFDTHLHWDAPPPKKPIPEAANNFEDMTGRKFGRFTVFGYFGKLNPKKKALWIVRCVCGDYELRHAAAIKNAPPNDCCRVCFDLRVKRRRYEVEGARPISDFFQPVGESA